MMWERNFYHSKWFWLLFYAYLLWTALRSSKDNCSDISTISHLDHFVIQRVKMTKINLMQNTVFYFKANESVRMTWGNQKWLLPASTEPFYIKASSNACSAKRKSFSLNGGTLLAHAFQSYPYFAEKFGHLVKPSNPTLWKCEDVFAFSGVRSVGSENHGTVN